MCSAAPVPPPSCPAASASGACCASCTARHVCTRHGAHTARPAHSGRNKRACLEERLDALPVTEAHEELHGEIRAAHVDVRGVRAVVVAVERADLCRLFARVA